MRRQTLLCTCIALLLMLAATPTCPLLAQSVDVTGTWQGTLHLADLGGNAGRSLRIVLKVSRAPDSSLTALNYSIDQGGEGMKASDVSLQGRTFRYTVPSLGGSYEGQLSANGDSITGKWAGQAPLVFVRATAATAWEVPAPPPPRKPMTATDPTFEVATIKPSDPDKPGKYFRVVARTYTAHAVSLADLIQVSYGLHPKQIMGGPDWVRTERFDLSAKPDAEGEPNAKQWLTMLQKLLVDRFGLVTHTTKQELSTFVLSVADGGPRTLTPSTSQNPYPGLEFRPVPGGVLLPARNATFGQFAQMMQQVVLDRPMLDRTGLSSRFDFQLRFTPDETQFNGHPPMAPQAEETEAAPGLVEALRQQLGLKLTVEKVPTDVLVIDRVHEPSPN